MFGGISAAHESLTINNPFRKSKSFCGTKEHEEWAFKNFSLVRMVVKRLCSLVTLYRRCELKNFPEFQERVKDFLNGTLSINDEVALKRLFCSDCDFFKPGEAEELCCSCFIILKKLVAGGYVTLKEISDALKE